MITVSTRFQKEQLKTHSAGETLKIMAYTDSDSMNLTPYFIRSSLSRIDWHLEDDLTAFESPDCQFSLWYDDVLWTWLNATDLIRIEIFTGFHFEQIRKFWGYIDKDNLKKDSMGRIYVRVYSFIDYLKRIKTSDIFGTPLDPPRYYNLSNVVKDIFDYLELDSYTIKVLPIDTYPDATTYVMSFLGTDLDDPDPDRNEICHIDDHHLYYANDHTLYLITFDTYYTTATITPIKTETNKNYIAIDKWDDDTWVLSKGTYRGFSYKNDSVQPEPGSAWELEELEFFNASGTSQGTQAISRFTDGSYTYIPVARGFKKLERVNAYIIVYNGRVTIGAVIDRCRIRVFNATSHSVIRWWSFTGHYHNPNFYSAAGYYVGTDYFFTFLSPNNDFWGNVLAIQIYPTTMTSWYLMQTSLNYTTTQVGDRLEALGPYVAIKYQSYAFDTHNNYMYPKFWSGAATADGLGKAHHAEVTDDPYQLLVAYNVSANKVMMRKLREDGYLTTYYSCSGALPDDYLMRITPTYWRTYENGYNAVGLALDPSNNVNLAIVGNQFYPFVKRPPLDENENLHDTIRDLAIAGACVYCFRDNTRGIFISREFYDDTPYTITADMIDKKWRITRQTPRRVAVSSGSMDVEVGEEYRVLNISSNYIPDYDDDIGKAYGQAYRNFLTNYPLIIEITGDFLVQYEPFDTIKFIDENRDEYLGKLMESVKEDMKVQLELRGKEI